MSLAARSKTILISHHIYDNWRAKKRFVAGDIESTSGSTHTPLALQDSLRYIDRAFDDYLVYSGLSHEMLRDKSILEIGPGDNVGIALKFLLAGASRRPRQILLSSGLRAATSHLPGHARSVEQRRKTSF